MSTPSGINGIQDDPEHPGLHQRRPGTLEVEQSSPAASADVEAAIGPVPLEHAKDAEEEEEVEYADVTYLDILKQFSLLGWTAFGGPAAHIGLFQRVRAYVCTQQLHNMMRYSEVIEWYAYLYGASMLRSKRQYADKFTGQDSQPELNAFQQSCCYRTTTTCMMHTVSFLCAAAPG